MIHPPDARPERGAILAKLAVAVVIALSLAAVVASGVTGIAGIPFVGSASNPASSNDVPGSTATTGPNGDIQMIRSVTVSAMAEGTRYLVAPTRTGRLAGGESLNLAWRQTVAQGVPNRPGLKQQFLCHPLSVVARAKSTWNLEDWRPTVGLTRTMLAGCNPA